jgi:CMP-N-acetylneuraminic acid synthetase
VTRDVLAIVPARGGSKGISRKNLVVVAGRSLLQWTIDAALQSRVVTRVVVSTDDAEIAELGRALGADVPFLRPPELARDDTPGVAPVLHALEALGDVAPWICLLQPTSPLRTAADIDAARRLAEESGADAVLGVTLVRQHVAWHKTLGPAGFLVAASSPPSVRQALPRTLVPNGAIYLCRAATVRASGTLTPTKTAPYEMPASRSVDVDIDDDLRIVEALLTGNHAR